MCFHYNYQLSETKSALSRAKRNQEPDSAGLRIRLSITINLFVYEYIFLITKRKTGKSHGILLVREITGNSCKSQLFLSKNYTNYEWDSSLKEENDKALKKLIYLYKKEVCNIFI